MSSNPTSTGAILKFTKRWMVCSTSGCSVASPVSASMQSRAFTKIPKCATIPYLPGRNAYGDRNIQHKYTDDLPQVHDVLKEVRSVVNKYPGDPVLVTEADEPNVEALTKMYGNGDEVQLPMDFQIADVNELSASRFRKLFNEIENNSAHGQPEYFFSNHDQPRQWDRYGDGEHNDQIAKLMAVLELTTRGTPQMYYGEELGMRTTDPARVEDVHDPIGKLGWPKEKGRDGERTPMQWDATPQAGFTTVTKPWLPIPPSSAQYNVEAESKDPNSILNTYKKLIALRKSEPALRDGIQISISNDRPNVFAYLRTTGDANIVVALNMSAKPQKIALDWASRIGRPLRRPSLFRSTSSTKVQHLVKSLLSLRCPPSRRSWQRWNSDHRPLKKAASAGDRGATQGRVPSGLAFETWARSLFNSPNPSPLC